MQIKRLLLLSIFILGIFAFAQWGEAATRYVNSDSDGTASAPTRPFDDGSYIPNNSYATVTACYNASSNGDTCEFSGGASGKSYVGYNTTMTKQLTFQGSQITGHKATVTITQGGSYVAYINANNFTLQDLTLDAGNSGGATAILNTNVTLTRVVLKNAANSIGHFRTTTAAGTITATDVTIDGSAGGATAFGLYLQGGTLTFNRLRMKNVGSYVLTTNGGSTATSVTINYSIFENGGFGIYADNTNMTLTLNNCVMNNFTYKAIYLLAGRTVTCNNCVFTNINLIEGTASYTFQFVGAGTLNTNNCLYQGSYLYARQFSTGTGTWNDVSPIINGFPYFTRTKPGMGFLVIGSDLDATADADFDKYKAVSDYAMNTYGIALTQFTPHTNILSAYAKTILQGLSKAGHEVASHGRSHSSMGGTNALTVTYSGAGTSMAVVVSASGTSLSITGTDPHGPYDLSVAYPTLTSLVTLIGGLSNFTCALVTSVTGDVLSTGLKDATTSLSGATGIPFDDSTASTNRYFTDQIFGSISDLETALHLDAGCATYTCKTFAWPQDIASAFALTWMSANSGLQAVRSDAGATYSWMKKMNLSHAQIWCLAPAFLLSNSKGADYAGLTAAQQQVRIQQAAKLIASLVSDGYIIHMQHASHDITLQEFQWFLDEVQKYRGTYGIRIGSFWEMVNQIKSSGSWTDAGSGYWDRTFTGTDDYHLLGGSPLINTGTNVSLTSDYYGIPVPIGSAPDIGVSEFLGLSALFFAM